MKFNKPELNIVRFDAADVIATSEQAAPFTVVGHGYGVMGCYDYKGQDTSVVYLDEKLDPRLKAMLPATLQLSGRFKESMKFDVSFNGTSFQITECVDGGHDGNVVKLSTETDFVNYLMSFVSAGN